MQIEVIIEKKSHKLDAEEGKTILETLQEHGIHVLTAPCGGRGRCGKCTVEVEHMGEVLACMTKSNRWYAYHNSESAASRTEV